MINIIDTHCHLNFKQFDEDVKDGAGNQRTDGKCCAKAVVSQIGLGTE